KDLICLCDLREVLIGAGWPAGAEEKAGERLVGWTEGLFAVELVESADLSLQLFEGTGEDVDADGGGVAHWAVEDGAGNPGEVAQSALCILCGIEVLRVGVVGEGVVAGGDAVFPYLNRFDSAIGELGLSVDR